MLVTTVCYLVQLLTLRQCGARREGRRSCRSSVKRDSNTVLAEVTEGEVMALLAVEAVADLGGEGEAAGISPAAPPPP